MKAKEFQDKLKSGEIQVGAKGRLISRAIDSQVAPKIFFEKKEKIANRKRVDYSLQPITNIKEWRKVHPTETYFDSLIEGQFYYFLIENNCAPIIKRTIKILDDFEYLGKKVRQITWTPDYIIANEYQDIIIDTKGFPNDSFDLKLKLIKNHFAEIGKKINKPVPHIWFVNRKSKFPIALNCIKRVLSQQDLDGIEEQLLFENNFNKKSKK